MEDIAPELLKKIRALFLELLGDDAPNANTYTAAGDYAERVGDALVAAFQRHLTSDVLPDGKMYWNIADRVVRPLLEEDWRLCTGAAAGVQRALNKAAGIGLAAQVPEPNKGRIDGILNTLCAAEQYEDEAWMLDEPVRTFSRAAVDETLRRNAEFQSKAGLRPRIVRTAEHGCCKWCSALAGVYDYPDVPDDVYKRHANCRCSVEYDSGGGKRQDVWTKRWTDGQERGILEQRKTVGLDPTANVIQTRINKGEYSLTQSHQGYLKHIEGTKQFEQYKASRIAKGQTAQSRLIISEEKAQELIRKYAGKGKPRIRKDGTVDNKEFFTAEYVVGQYCDGNGKYRDTQRVEIHYAKNSCHIVPVKEKNKND